MKEKIKKVFNKILPDAPLLAWLIGILAASFFEQFAGNIIAVILGLSKIPVLFGCLIILKQPLLILSALLYVTIVYFCPTVITAWIIRKPANKISWLLFKYPVFISTALHLIILYAALHVWADINAYRSIILRLTLIAIILTLSLNIINGYMGEFSCSHPGFMAVGAYAGSVLTLSLFTDEKVFGLALLPHWIGPFLFPLCIIAAGLAAAISSMAVAIPSFKTRGDYLAIISLAFMFIIKSVIENLEIIRGPRGLTDLPNYAGLPIVFMWTVICIWTVNNFVSSTMGKALNAVRDGELAAGAMTINTNKTKMTAFMFSAFWAGVAGALFAHVIRYVNPGTFGLQKLAEVLAMVYFGGLNSIYGSIMGAVSLSILGEALRPLEIFKWLIIPLLLILVMIFRPKGLISFKEFDIIKLIKPREKL